MTLAQARFPGRRSEIAAGRMREGPADDEDGHSAKPGRQHGSRARGRMLKTAGSHDELPSGPGPYILEYNDAAVWDAKSQHARCYSSARGHYSRVVHHLFRSPRTPGRDAHAEWWRAIHDRPKDDRPRPPKQHPSEHREGGFCSIIRPPRDWYTGLPSPRSMFPPSSESRVPRQATAPRWRISPERKKPGRVKLGLGGVGMSSDDERKKKKATWSSSMDKSRWVPTTIIRPVQSRGKIC